MCKLSKNPSKNVLELKDSLRLLRLMAHTDFFNYRDAEKLLKKSLDMRESLFGPTHAAVSQSLDSLATSYKNKKM